MLIHELVLDEQAVLVCITKHCWMRGEELLFPQCAVQEDQNDKMMRSTQSEAGKNRWLSPTGHLLRPVTV